MLKIKKIFTLFYSFVLLNIFYIKCYADMVYSSEQESKAAMIKQYAATIISVILIISITVLFIIGVIKKFCNKKKEKNT